MIGKGEGQDPVYYKLGRLAVLKSYRQYRFGRDLVLALHKWVKEDTKCSYDYLEVAKVIAHSQIPVKPFYSKCVFHLILAPAHESHAFSKVWVSARGDFHFQKLLS